MTFFFPVELHYLGSAPTFYLYGVILVTGLYFIHRKIPETKGMSLEEIEEYFKRTSELKILTTNPVVQSSGDRAIDKYAENYKLSPVI